jgi:hypothetical protein
MPAEDFLASGGLAFGRTAGIGAVGGIGVLGGIVVGIRPACPVTRSILQRVIDRLHNAKTGR